VSQAKVDSTTQRLGNKTKPLYSWGRSTCIPPLYMKYLY